VLMKSHERVDGSRAKRLAAQVHFPRLLNARDLGGCTMRGGAQTRARSILRTDDLWRLTPDGVRALLDYGVRSIIDLRWPHELGSRPSIFQRGVRGVRYTNVSLLDGTENAWNAKSPGVSKEKWNCAVLDHSPRELAQVLRAVADAPPGVVLFHCVAGKDRTGVIAALLLAAADVEPEEIAGDYSVSTDYIRDAYLSAHPPEAREAILEEVRCPPEQIYNMLEHLDHRYGGTMSYFRMIGLRADEIERIRNRLLPDVKSPAA
jgi:protein-tyrosine phosphatase